MRRQFAQDTGPLATEAGYGLHWLLPKFFGKSTSCEYPRNTPRLTVVDSGKDQALWSSSLGHAAFLAASHQLLPLLCNMIVGSCQVGMSLGRGIFKSQRCLYMCHQWIYTQSHISTCLPVSSLTTNMAGSKGTLEVELVSVNTCCLTNYPKIQKPGTTAI